jgi:hypothetical protein
MVCIEFCLPIGCGTLIDEKIRQIAALFWFGLRDVGILYSRDVIIRTIDVSPTFWVHGSALKITASAHLNRNPNKEEV